MLRNKPILMSNFVLAKCYDIALGPSAIPFIHVSKGTPDVKCIDEL